jgi:hypothetical protein
MRKLAGKVLSWYGRLLSRGKPRWYIRSIDLYRVLLIVTLAVFTNIEDMECLPYECRSKISPVV